MISRIGEVTPKDLDESIAGPVFDVKAGEITDPIQGPFGWVIVRVLSVVEGQTVTFDDVKDDIKSKIALEKAGAELYDIYNAIEDQLAGGATLTEVAEETNITLQTVTAADRSGQDKQGNEVTSIAKHPSIIQEAFAVEIGDENYMQQAADGSYFVVEVKDSEPTRLKEFNEVSEDVKNQWIAAERKRKLQSLAENFSERGNSGEKFETLGTEIDRAVSISPPIPRGGSNETFSRALVEALFETDKDKFVVGPVGIGESVVVAQVTDIIEPKLEDSKEAIARLQIETNGSLSNELITHYINDVRNNLGVEKYPDMINRAVGVAN